MLWVVHKSPVGLNASELLGVFTDEAKAASVCIGVGTYYVAKVQPDRHYQIGSLLDVEVRVVTSIAAIETYVEGGHGPGLHPRRN